jgi:hypothetical protein
LYALASLTLFLTKSTDPLLQSTMRYVLAVFPSFVALAIVLDKRQVGLAAVLAFLALLNGVVLFEFWQWSLLV